MNTNTVTFLHIDAFNDPTRRFSGNQAGVFLLPDGLDINTDELTAEFQCHTTELCLPTCAFVSRRQCQPGHSVEAYAIRWFNVQAEIPLCGHATLATAHALWETETSSSATIEFQYNGGTISVERASPDTHTTGRDGRVYAEYGMQLAAIPPLNSVSDELASAIMQGLRLEPHQGRVVGSNHIDTLVEVDSEATLLAIVPDWPTLNTAKTRSAIVTTMQAIQSPGVDISTRVFNIPIGEDAVTGSAHACLVPHFNPGHRVTCFQASARSGRLTAVYDGTSVTLTSTCHTVHATRVHMALPPSPTS
eukprot:GFYU01002641.1.p1 GENE.GFYU01002641.1~~GFYU01002641.1.p1  ORF type:complete len:317 (+),score=50.70 GFYU01002641.1:38-952(+)